MAKVLLSPRLFRFLVNPKAVNWLDSKPRRPCGRGISYHRNLNHGQDTRANRISNRIWWNFYADRILLQRLQGDSNIETCQNSVNYPIHLRVYLNCELDARRASGLRARV